ncbi:MAG: 23S rRNA (uracil(1939)-C(5))-methyltransferase RlmD [Proteobacteria bacterium]|nr:23S rRNA (uracil(1939)-C(5))-methyltransferase RlmD [Pseudomonadota bacterium]
MPPAAAETATVADLTHDGAGVVRGGKTAFVPGTLPGEEIRFRRTRSHRQYDEGQLIEVLQPAPSRVAARCPHFGVCGGCVLQHMDPQAQLASKEAQLRDSLARVGEVQPQRWLEPLTGPVWGYRRRARLSVRYVHKKHTAVVGFRERAAPYVAQLAGCEVLAAPAGALIEPLVRLINSLQVREQLPQIEVAVADNATALVLRVLCEPQEADLQRLAQFEREHALRLYLQPGGLDSVRPLHAGGAPLHYRLRAFDLTLQFEPTDFIQVNGAVNALLVECAVELLDLTPAARVLDLYCGLGNFTLALARRAAMVVGVEGEPGLIERARANADANGIGNAQFHCADLAAPAAAAQWPAEGFSHVLLDPPRTGAREMLGSLARVAPRRVLYISCHPGSLARDLKVLVHEYGFTLAAAGVVDMFPHTAHVESVALLHTPAEVRRA